MAIDRQSQRNSCFRHLPPFLTPSVLAILLTECAERFSYFGFRAILVLYLHMVLGFDETTSVALFAYVSCAAYLTPIIGAIVADAYLGRYTTILVFGLSYFVGLCIMTFGAYLPGKVDNNDSNLDESDADAGLFLKKLCTLIGLSLACIGTGGIKPCVSAFGADQVGVSANDEAHGGSTKPQCDDRGEMVHLEAVGKGGQDYGKKDNQQDDVRAFFSYFYSCINVGAVLSIAIVPIIRGQYGFGAAFLAPTIFLCFAITVFVSKRKTYKMHKPGSGSDEGGHDSSLYTTFVVYFLLLRENVRTIDIFACCSGRQGKDHQKLKNIPANGDQPVYIDQAGSLREGNVSGPTESDATAISWDDSDAPLNGSIHNTLRQRFSAQQIEDAETVLHITPVLSLLPVFWMLYDQQGSVWTLQATRMELHGLQPEQLNVVNPIEIILLIPLFERIIYPGLEARRWKVTHLRRMAAGMVLTAISFSISGALESEMQRREATSGEKISVFWQLPQITILACGEILVSVTGLEFSYACSPGRMKAFLMSLYLLTTAAGDFLGGLLYSSVFKTLNRASAMHVCAILMVLNLVVFSRVAKWWEAAKNAEVTSTDSGHATTPFEQGDTDVTSHSCGMQTVDRTKSAISSQSLLGDCVELNGGGRNAVELTMLRKIT